jgi:hypothetical protein
VNAVGARTYNLRLRRNAHGPVVPPFTPAPCCGVSSFIIGFGVSLREVHGTARRPCPSYDGFSLWRGFASSLGPRKEHLSPARSRTTVILMLTVDGGDLGVSGNQPWHSIFNQF